MPLLQERIETATAALLKAEAEALSLFLALHFRSLEH